MADFSLSGLSFGIPSTEAPAAERRTVGRLRRREDSCSAHLLHSPSQQTEDANVQKEGDDERDVERAAGRVEDVSGRLEENALEDGRHVVVDVVLRQFSPSQGRRNTDRPGNRPDEADVGSRLLRRPFLVVPERIECGSEAIEGYHAKVPDGCGAVEHVQGQPEVAHHSPEDPVAETFVDARQRQDGDGKEQVAERKIADQKVRNSSEEAIAEEGDDYETVSEGSDEDEEDENEGHDRHASDVVVQRSRPLRRQPSSTVCCLHN